MLAGRSHVNQVRRVCHYYNLFLKNITVVRNQCCSLFKNISALREMNRSGIAGDNMDGTITGAFVSQASTKKLITPTYEIFYISKHQQ